MFLSLLHKKPVIKKAQLDIRNQSSLMSYYGFCLTNGEDMIRVYVANWWVRPALYEEWHVCLLNYHFLPEPACTPSLH